MSETLPRSREHGGELDTRSAEAAQERSRELAGEKIREAQEAEKNKPSIDAIQERIEKARNNAEHKDSGKAETAASESAVPFGSNYYGHNATKRMLVKVQKQLSPTERAGSKVIHQPVVEAVSNAAGATIARPSGLLLGGLFSLISSLVVLYICRHYGYEYNFMIGLAGFVGGFALGILLEGILKLFRHA